MKIAVHHVKNDFKGNFSKKWIESLRSKNQEVVVVDLKTKSGFEQALKCDGVMWHWLHMPDDKISAPRILDTIEHVCNIKVFPNFKTRWHFDEKVSQHYLLESMNVPKIKSYVFWNHKDAREFFDKTKYPKVFKLSVGAGSSNVLKISDKNDAKKYVDNIFKRGIVPYTLNEYSLKGIRGIKNIIAEFPHRLLDSVNYMVNGVYPRLPAYHLIQKNYLYAQEFLPNNSNDIRITVIGGRAFGYIRHNRPNDFRASGSGNFSVDPKNIPLKAVLIALKTSKLCGFQSMAYDFLVNDKGQPLVNEISYAFVDWMVHECPGYWDIDSKWHVGHFWPQELHVDDFLKSFKKGK